MMQAKNVLYAAVGAPIVAARKMSDQVGTWKAKVDKETASYTEAAEKALNTWAAEGEKAISRIGDRAVVEEISQKVDLDQAKEQVSKLRDQLEDMLATWRTSFRPEDKTQVEKTEATTEAPVKKAPAKTTAKRAPSKKPAAKTTAKKAPAKEPAAKKPAAKKPAATTTASAKTTKAS